MLEFGLVFTHNLTLEYATREGARTGSALAKGKGVAAVCLTIDPQIIAAVERVLKSPGSPVDMSKIGSIKIWKSTSTGAPTSTGQTSTWTYQPAGGPTVDGVKLDFVESVSSTWTPCTRNNGANPDSIGVSLTYTYYLVTPLNAVAGLASRATGSPLFAGGTLAMSDRTIMSLNP